MSHPKWLDPIFESIRTTYKTYPEVFIFSFITIGVLFFFRFISDSNKLNVDAIKTYHYSADLKNSGKIEYNNQARFHQSM
jgi:hypothetical protein